MWPDEAALGDRRRNEIGRTRILFLTCHLPYPPYSGGRLREFELLKRLAARFDVHLCAVSKTFPEDVANADALRRWCSEVTLFTADATDGVTGQDPRPFQVRRHASGEMIGYLRDLEDTIRPDVIHVEGFYLMQHLPQPLRAPVLLVEQNVEYLLWRQRAETAVGRDDRDHVLREYLLTLESETEAWRSASLCAAVTNEDRDAMLAAEPGLDVRVVPDGADHLYRRDLAQRERPPQRNVVAFIANFAYAPNIDGALHLLHRIFPRVRARVPGTQLLLVGNAPPAEVVEAARVTPGVVVTGRVPDVEPYLAAATLIVCPLRIGGGVKVKVLEALSRGKAIVTTSVGAQGLGPRAAEAMEIHDRPSAFVDAVVRLLRRPRRRGALESAAREFARELPTWDTAARELEACYDELLRPTTQHDPTGDKLESLT